MLRLKIRLKPNISLHVTQRRGSACTSTEMVLAQLNETLAEHLAAAGLIWVGGHSDVPSRTSGTLQLSLLPILKAI